MSRAFEEKELLEQVDNDWDFLADTVQMLAADGPALINDIRRAADTGDAPAAARSAHALKGMISNFCSPAAHSRAQAVEQLSRSGDLTPLPAAVAALESEFKTLVGDLTKFVA